MIGRGRTGRSLRLAWWVLAALFVALGSWIEIAGGVPGDERALVELNEALGTTLDRPMVLLGNGTDLVPLGALGLSIMVLLIKVSRRFDAVLFAAFVGVALVTNPLLKWLVARPRPTIRTIPESLSTYSFPSGHAANTAALVGALILITRGRTARLSVAVVGSIALIAVGFSRLAIGAHYPSDIIGGWLWVGAWTAFWAAHGGSRAEPTASSDRAS
ncbi:MAG: phosphatase PAP2 family protein [Acidimicrobiia bacterium]|nr:phosphatase PAP2 family protein [Acidimicrobiia bacterium]